MLSTPLHLAYLFLAKGCFIRIYFLFIVRSSRLRILAKCALMKNPNKVKTSPRLLVFAQHQNIFFNLLAGVLQLISSFAWKRGHRLALQAGPILVFKIIKGVDGVSPSTCFLRLPEPGLMGTPTDYCMDRAVLGVGAVHFLYD